MFEKIVQIVNAGSSIGGTSACATDITKCYPECEHIILSKNIEQSLFPGISVRQRRCVDLWEFKNSLIFLHNTPNDVVEGCVHPTSIALYYAHGFYPMNKRCAEKASQTIFVSRYLRNQYSPLISDSSVVYQPVMEPYRIPARERTHKLVIGRICTPRPHKWKLGELLPFYAEMRSIRDSPMLSPDVHWVFVGATREFREAVGGLFASIEFIEPSLSARSEMHTWDILLYHSTLHETYGRVLHESQKCGCYPLMSNHSGFREQATNWGGACLFSRPSNAVSVINGVLEEGNYAARRDAIRAAGARRGTAESFRADISRVLGISMDTGSGS